MGSFFTWTNKSDGDRMITYKLDGILVNEFWLDNYLNSTGIFKSNFLLDHCPNIPIGGD